MSRSQSAPFLPAKPLWRTLPQRRRRWGGRERRSCRGLGGGHSAGRNRLRTPLAAGSRTEKGGRNRSAFACGGLFFTKRSNGAGKDAPVGGKCGILALTEMKALQAVDKGGRRRSLVNQAEQFSNWLNYLVIACYIYLLVPSRVSRKKTAAVLAAGSSAIFLLNCLLFLRRGQALDATFNVLTIVLPMVLLSLTFAKYRDARTAFSVVAACSIMMGVGIVGEILKNILSPWWEVPLELALHLALLTAIARVFREQFFSILERFRRPWLLLTAVPLLYCKIFDLLVESPGFSPYWGEGAVALLLVICAMMATYVLLLLLFHQLRIQLEQERANQVLMTQVEMMKAQEQAILSSEARIRIYRHDLRHYLQIADEHLRGGRYQEARQIVNDLDEQASKSAAVRCYCKNLTVNAALSVYLRQAEEEGIAVHSALEFPDPLPAEELELAVVLANAAENALHACQKMPVSAQRSIVLSGQVVGDSFLLEVANTYQGQIAIDPKSELPFAEEEEHGIGTKSMLAFARKYGILIDCSAEGGWFVLRLLFQMGER